ncbi:MAG: histidine kinase, partial [Candidatus Thiodiazotropha sp.]
HPGMGARLLKHIPRLEVVADMVERQNDSVGRIEFQGKLSNEDKAILGGQILRVAIGYEKLLSQGLDEQAAIDELKDNPAHYDPILVETLALGSQNRKVEVMTLPIDRLEPGLILDQPIKTNAGTLLVAKGQVLSQAVLFRLLAAAESGIVSSEVRVFRVT